MRWLLVLAVACSSPQPPVASAPRPPSDHAISLAADHAVADEVVTFTVGTRQIPGTLTAPTAAGRWPAIVMLAGSGPTDRDWNSARMPTLRGSAPQLATELARHGAVVLRFDKAGSGKNPGPPLDAFTLDTYRDEAAAAVALLRARANVRGDRVFVIGHSEGGIHATRLAQVAAPPLAGVIYLASVGRTMADLIVEQLAVQLKAPALLLSDKAIEEEVARIRTAFADFMANKPVDPQAASRIPQLQQLVAQVVKPQTAAVTRAMLGYDITVDAPKLPGPFLVIAGGKDLQIDVELDVRRLERALRAGGRDVTFHLAPDANHMIRHEPMPLAELRANRAAAIQGYSDRPLDTTVVAAIVGWLAGLERERER